MKHVKPQVPRRAQSLTGAVARTRKDAAIQMVRLEFEAARLERSIDHAQRRAAGFSAELGDLEKRRAGLLDKLKS